MFPVQFIDRLSHLEDGDDAATVTQGEEEGIGVSDVHGMILAKFGRSMSDLEKGAREKDLEDDSCSRASSPKQRA